MSGDDLLLVMMDIEPELEQQFNRWYDEEHMPEMQRMPGVLAAARYRALQGQPKYMALYDLQSVEALERPEYLRIAAWSPHASPRSQEMFSRFRRVTRGVYTHTFTESSTSQRSLPARALLVRGLEIAPEREEEFLEWDSTEHLPSLCRVPGVLGARRYCLHSEASNLIGRPSTYLVRYDLASPEVQASAEWRAALDSPWSRRVRRFYTSPLRNVYERVFP